MRKLFMRKLLMAMGITLLACLLFYPLLLPTENYFRLLLQLLPVAVITGLLLLIPLYFICDRFSRDITAELKNVKLDSRQALADFPELRPIARQITSLRMQTETQKSELEGQQEQLKTLTDNMQEGLLLVGASGRVLSHNDAALRLLGKESLSGEFDVSELNDAPEFSALVNDALNGVRGETMLPVNGIACRIIGNPVTRGSMMTGAVLVLLDVTEQEQKEALRRTFLSELSGELTPPLQTIQGIAETMESGKVKLKEVKDYAARIRTESARTSAMIADSLLLSRLDGSGMDEEKQPVDLYEIAQEIRNEFLPLAEEKGIELTLEGEAAAMQGIPSLLAEILRKLCENAIKYNTENGSVKIKVTSTEQSVILTVSDTGIGIPQADCAHIFDRFYAVDKSRSKELGGTGLGLSVVRQSAACHHASIEVESQLGSGTTMTLFFPRSAEAAAQAEREARLNPLDVTVPGAAQSAMVQVRGGDTEPAEEPQPEAEPVAEAELPDEAPAEEPAEPEPEPAEPAAPVTEEPAADAEEITFEFDTEEPPAPAPAPTPRVRRKKKKVPRKKEAEPSAEEAQLSFFTEQPVMKEPPPPAPQTDPEEAPQPAASAADARRHDPKLPFDPDIVPIDETTMDIKI